MIVIRDLSKAYGRHLAVSRLSLEIQKGEIFGLVGPNGSGKTTTIRILLGLLHPTSGSAAVAGFDCWKQSIDVRRLVSYLPGELRMYGSMTGLGILRFFSDLRGGEGLDRAVAIAEELMGLDLSRKVRSYSTGMKQKLALAQTFSDPVEILILDEPTSALDPSARSDVLRLVKAAKSQGQTVIFSGHVLSEVEEVCDRLAILRQGRMMHLANLRDRRNLRLLLIRFANEVPPTFPAELKLTERERTARTCLLEHRGTVGPLLHWLNSQPVEDLAIGTEDLRSLYDQYHGPNATASPQEPNA